MSYARWSASSSVYVFAHHNGQIQCCGCVLADDGGSFDAWSTDEIVEHVERHLTAGHTIPSTLIAALRADDAANFPALGGADR